jgi:Pvc16 N-terminal domain
VSTALAIASVTAVLRDLLNNGLIDHDVSNVLESDVTVTSLPPDRIDITPSAQVSQLNVFLYHVSPNVAWRNARLPSRDSDGNRISNPPLALDLHYLITAYGVQELDSEILLGYAMQLLHETPILTRAAIRRSLAPPSIVGTGTDIPARLRELATSELAEQFEQIRIVPVQLNTEEMSKLWAAFGTKYRPTAAYQASVVLIESRQSARGALPVLSRGIYVRPFRQPFITRVLSRTGPTAPILPDQPILFDHDVVLEGTDLRGEPNQTFVMMSGTEVAPAEDNITSERIITAIPSTLFAGIHAVQVVHRQPMGFMSLPHVGPESNLAVFVLRPTISNITVPDADTIRFDVTPPVAPAQRVTLLMNGLTGSPAPAYSFDLPSRFVLSSLPPGPPPPPITTLEFDIAGVAAGDYLLRVQVDGAESPLRLGPDNRYAEPHAVIP